MKLLVLLASTCVGLIATTAAQIPNRISYQAEITDADGNPLNQTDPGEHDFFFRIWSSATGGDLLWAEKQENVTVLGGTFSTLLGTGDAIPGEPSDLELSFLGNPEAYLEIGLVEGNSTKTFAPRQQLVSSPFAFYAKSAESVVAAGVGTAQLADASIIGTKLAPEAVGSAHIAPAAVGKTQIGSEVVGSSHVENGSLHLEDLANAVVARLNPAGSVSAWAGRDSTVPDGWLLCNGAEVAKSDYPELFEAIGYVYGGSGTHFRLPDYQGMFLRGLDGAGQTDPDKSSRTKAPRAEGDFVGSTQGDAFKKHNHNPNSTHVLLMRKNAGAEGSGIRGGDHGGSRINGYDTTGEIMDVGGAETRPKNIYVHYIIKAH